MLKLLQVILASAVIVAVNGFTGYTLQYMGNMKHPDLPNHCYYPKHDLSIATNETLYPKDLDNACIKVYCRDDFVLEIRHCQIFDSSKGCTQGQHDYTRVFPVCCPVVTCNNIDFYTEDY